MSPPRATAAVTVAACALFLVAVALIAAPFAAPSADPMRGLAVPTLVAPRGSAQIALNLTRTSWLTVDVRRGDRIVRHLVTDSPFAPGPVRTSWDGRDDRGLAVAPGRYEVRVVGHPGRRAFILSRHIEVRA